jgi:hypothetical protein
MTWIGQTTSAAMRAHDQQTVQAKGVGTLPEWLALSLLPILTALAIPDAAVRAECECMREHRIDRTASRRVPGPLNELMFLLEHGLAQTT